MKTKSALTRQAAERYSAIHLISSNGLDRLVSMIVDLMLIWGVSASLAYWLVFLFRLPAWFWYPTLVVIVGGVIYLFQQRVVRHVKVIVNGWALPLLLTCIVSAAINVFTNRPDSDDIAFSHRAVFAASNLSIPISMTDTVHDVVNLPPITPLHVFTSVEVTTALVGRILGIPQLLALHMGLGTLVNLMLPAVYYLLLRFFRVRVPYAVLGTMGILVFFVMSGNVHRDWGNFTIMRSWQGKCILMELIIPLALLYSLRFHLYGRKCDAIRLHAVTCCGIGLSSTGLFLVPFVVGVSAGAVWVVTKFSRRSMARTAMSATILSQPIVVSALPWLGFLPKLGDISFYITGGWPLDYAENLGMVFHAQSIPLYLAYLCTALFVRRRVELLAFLIYLGIALILLMAPGTRNLLMNIVTPGAYWRFSYALFVPLFVGLALAGLGGYIDRSGMSRFIAVSWLTILVVATFIVKIPALNHKSLSAPGPKFERSTMEQVYQISDLAKNDSVMLAPQSIVPPLGLLRPDIKFIVTRPGETLLAFRNVGLNGEGALRGALGTALETCNFANISNVHSEQLWPDMSLVVYPAHCATERIRTHLALGNNWREASLREYRVLLRNQK